MNIFEKQTSQEINLLCKHQKKRKSQPFYRRLIRKTSVKKHITTIPATLVLLRGKVDLTSLEKQSF